jgi:hypothetical protein
MILTLKNPSRTVELVRRAFFLAYNACGGAMGMGVFQARDGVTEEHVWQNVLTRGDYGGTFGNDRPERPYGDYVFGRMMKLSAEFNEANGTVTISDSKPRYDYQSWCGKYPTYQSLFVAAATELGIALEGYNIAEQTATPAAEPTPLPPPANNFTEAEAQTILDAHPISIKAVRFD